MRARRAWWRERDGKPWPSAGTPSDRVSVAGEGDRHLVLEDVGVPGLDAVHQESEGEPPSRDGRAVADERRDVVQRAGLRVAAVLGGRAAHAVVDRAGAA